MVEPQQHAIEAFKSTVNCIRVVRQLPISAFLFKESFEITR